MYSVHIRRDTEHCLCVGGPNKVIRVQSECTTEEIYIYD